MYPSFSFMPVHGLTRNAVLLSEWFSIPVSSFFHPSLLAVLSPVQGFSRVIVVRGVRRALQWEFTIRCRSECLDSRRLGTGVHLRQFLRKPMQETTVTF